MVSVGPSGSDALSYMFLSSRRRHTRYIGDWSSDVCSSDLTWLVQPLPSCQEQRVKEFLTHYTSGTLMAGIVSIGDLVYRERQSREARSRRRFEDLGLRDSEWRNMAGHGNGKGPVGCGPAGHLAPATCRSRAIRASEAGRFRCGSEHGGASRPRFGSGNAENLSAG